VSSIDINQRLFLFPSDTLGLEVGLWVWLQLIAAELVERCMSWFALRALHGTVALSSLILTIIAT
jgi:hypothetical protein